MFYFVSVFAAWKYHGYVIFMYDVHLDVSSIIYNHDARIPILSQTPWRRGGQKSTFVIVKLQELAMKTSSCDNRKIHMSDIQWYYGSIIGR